MATKLDQLLADIDPEKTIKKTYNRANEAINALNCSTGLIDSWGEFTDFMGGFLKHLDYYTLHLYEPVDVSIDYYWSVCARILMRIYGKNGEKAAFDMARTGNDGGLYAVLKALAMHVAEEYSQNEIRARISHYWNELSVDEQLEAADEYIEKYGHLLPSELTEKSAGRVRANLPKYLEKHPSMIQKLRGIGR